MITDQTTQHSDTANKPGAPEAHESAEPHDTAGATGGTDTPASELPDTEVIRAEDLGVFFKTGGREDSRSLVLQLLTGKKGQNGAFHALKGVSFRAFHGEVLGIIGANGAGKTTLCSAIARVLRPDSGTLTVEGEVSALLSMGTGFKNELTGRENILLNGLILGFSRRQIEEHSAEVVEFADLGEFIDAPVKQYSKGMRSRLGFSIATMLEPEVLVLDEALSAGDMEFSERATARMQELVAKAKAVVVVTHNLGFIESACDRAVWIDRGVVRAEGDAKTVAAEYAASVPPRERSRILGEKIETTITPRTVLEAKNVSVGFKVNRRGFWALRDVSFSVTEGEVVGIIGHNGAGKTTLCRALTRIYRPDEGTVRVQGEIAALLSMGAGFHRQLTADDNIVLNGLLLGIPKRRIEALRDDIIAFAELEAHRHKPVKYYSSGMASRLSFSIAVSLDPSLLIIDEALGAGDLAFKQKATEAMQRMIDRAEAVIVVTHNVSFVESVCTRALWLDRGELKFDGDPGEAVARYKQAVKERKRHKKRAPAR